MIQEPTDCMMGVWPEKLGNHRAVFRVDDETEDIFVRILW